MKLFERDNPSSRGGPNSLSRRFSFALSAVVVIILLLFSLGGILYNYQRIERNLDEQLAGTLELAETSLPTAVWQMDYSSMEDILGAILINETIVSVRIITDSTVAVAKTQAQYENFDFSDFVGSARFTVRSVDVKRSGEQVGVFEVALSRAAIARDTLMTVVVVFVLALILCTAILLTSVFLTKRYVFQPLEELEYHARLIAEGDLGTVIKTEGNDELAQLAATFNRMANRLKVSFDTLEQKVSERTADLYLAKTTAEKTNQYLGVVGAELQALLDNSPVGILFVDFDWVIQRINPEISRITKYTPPELIGYSMKKLFASEEEFNKIGVIGSPLFGKDGFCEMNIEITTKDGLRLMCYWRGRIIATEGGIEGVVWSVEDISLRLKMEEELLRARKLESIGVLAGGIAHDFNNILLAIIGNISLAERMLDKDSEILPLLLTAQKASLRARDLTVKLLTFASGGDPVKVAESLPQLLKESASFVLSGSNVKCDFTFGKDLWQVSLDKAQISQVIQNLVVNADQSMPNGGIVSISCDNVEVAKGSLVGLEEGRYVRVAVQDHGSGISRENIGKVFDPYFSTKGKNSTKGSGLGLSIVHSIITKHGGKIMVESTLGEGSRFTIYLPAMVAEAQIITDAKKRQTEGKGRILVMDDEEIIRNVISKMLEYLGYQSQQCVDGSEAISMYTESLHRGRAFDAVIMDLTIPGGMGGEEAARKLMDLDPQAKIIVSSGYSQDPILDNYRNFGFCNIVSKPYRMEDLSRVLDETLVA